MPDQSWIFWAYAIAYIRDKTNTTLKAGWWHKTKKETERHVQYKIQGDVFKMLFG